MPPNRPGGHAQLATALYRIVVLENSRLLRDMDRGGGERTTPPLMYAIHMTTHSHPSTISLLHESGD